MSANKIFRFAAAPTLGLAVVALLAPALCRAQVFQLTKEELIELTPTTFERFPDGRPKVPDALLERVRGLSSEEVGRSQYTDGFQVLHPGMKMVGRAFTVQFMPSRTELDGFARSRAQKAGINGLNNQSVIDMLQPGDIICVDLFGKKQQGTFVGDNLFYYIMRATKGAGMVLDGSIRDLEGIATMEMPLYFMHTDPSAIGQVTVAGWNIPIRIGAATVLPGDVVMGDREGLNFLRPSEVEQIVNAADRTHIHDDWTRQQFDTGKYKSSEIYSSPRDPAKKKEYDDYLKKRLDELQKK